MFKKLYNMLKSFIFCSSCKQEPKVNNKPRDFHNTYFKIKVDDNLLFYFKEQLRQNELTPKAQELYDTYIHDPDCPHFIVCLALLIFHERDDIDDLIRAAMKLFLYDYYQNDGFNHCMYIIYMWRTIFERPIKEYAKRKKADDEILIAIDSFLNEISNENLFERFKYSMV